MSAPRGTVIIPAWNAAEVLPACLRSVAQQEFSGGLETIVVDNASTDGTAELLRQAPEGVRVITNERNADFSGANNQAAAVARGSVLFFLNSDTELLAPDVLERLAEVAEAPEVGIAGPKLLNPDGTLQPSCAAHPSVTRALLVGTGLQRLLPDRVRARLHPPLWSHSREQDVDWVKGAAMAVRAEAFARVGGFWPLLFAQEQDLAYRMQQHGLRARFEPAAEVMHVGNHSGSQRWSDSQRAARVAAAELTLLGTHYSRPRALAIRGIMAAALGARAALHGVLRRPKAEVYRAMARVYVSGASPR